MNILYFDCFSGAAGDMILGALLDAGVPLDGLRRALGSLAIDREAVWTERVIRIKIVSIGSLDSTVVHPREVFREAASASAAAIVLFHNHPSGDPTPSPDDLVLTTRMVSAGDIMGIDVVDHLILADQRYFSLVESGRLPPRLA